MSKVYMMITITNRNMITTFRNFYQDHMLHLSFASLGEGTANSEVLDYLGLEATEKAVLFSFVTETVWKELKRGLERDLKIDVPGTGIAFITPISSIAGRNTLFFLTENQEFVKEEESTMKQTAYELIIVIANEGYSEPIMESARVAGARGGTIIHAKGTGMERAEKFLGVTLADEKEMIFIVAKSEEKNTIMKSIIEHNGIDSKAKALVFSLPVCSTAGMRLQEDSDLEESL